MTNPQPVPEQRSWNPRKQILWNSHWKSPGQERTWTHGNKKSRELPAPQPTLIHKLSMTPMVWNISIGQTDCVSGCALSQLLHTCSLAEYEKQEKSPWFHSNNWKLQCYQHSFCTKSKAQQLLRGSLTLSQPKPGHSVKCKCLAVYYVIDDMFGWTYFLRAPTATHLQSTSTPLSEASDWEPLALAIYLHIYCPAFCINLWQYAILCNSRSSAAPKIKLVVQVAEQRREARLCSWLSSAEHNLSQWVYSD